LKQIFTILLILFFTLCCLIFIIHVVETNVHYFYFVFLLKMQSLQNVDFYSPVKHIWKGLQMFTFFFFFLVWISGGNQVSKMNKWINIYMSWSIRGLIIVADRHNTSNICKNWYDTIWSLCDLSILLLTFGNGWVENNTEEPVYPL
jgi:hypothetical protein